MIHHLYAKFLTDPWIYREAEAYWLKIWESIDPSVRGAYQWTTPWVHTGSPEILDGNPIFSAVSRTLARGIRIIQHEPTSGDLEIQAWPNRFGGNVGDPESIHELVIACALSDSAAAHAGLLMDQWVNGQSNIFEDDRGKLLVPIDANLDHFKTV